MEYKARITDPELLAGMKEVGRLMPDWMRSELAKSINFDNEVKLGSIKKQNPASTSVNAKSLEVQQPIAGFYNQLPPNTSKDETLVDETKSSATGSRNTKDSNTKI